MAASSMMIGEIMNSIMAQQATQPGASDNANPEMQQYEHDSNEFIDALWERAEENGMTGQIISHTSMSFAMKINDQGFRGIIDTGAMSNAMSLKTAKQLGITDYIDTRCSGIAKGIGGSSRIIGTIPCIDVHIGNYVVPISFDIGENDMDTLIGMTFLRHHGVVIDIENMRITIGGTNIDIMIET